MENNSFKLQDTGLLPWIVRACEEKNIFLATPVQQAIIPVIIKGRNSIALSRTGTGKTLSFILPLIHISYLKSRECFKGIIVPTLELGLQIYEIYNTLGKNKNIKGTFLEKNNRINFFNEKLESCLIATIFSLNRNFIKNKKSTGHNILIFDEADLLIKPSNFALVKKIIIMIAPSQINLFGVTNTNVFRYFKTFRFRKNIFFFHEKHKKFAVFSEIKHEYIFCSTQFKLKFLISLLRFREKNRNREGKCSPILIFLKDRKKLENFVENLKKNKIAVSTLHHEMDIFQRTLSIQLIKKGVTGILVTTDLGSRGINFPFVHSMINLDIPIKTQTYLHRIGRIGRFSKEGYCLNLINEKEINFLHNIEKNTGFCINKSKLDCKGDGFYKIL